MPPTDPPSDSAPAQPQPDQNVAITRVMLDLIAARGLEKSICPSEVARALAGGHPDQWGKLMTPIRRVAVQLAKAGRIVIQRKGRPVDPDDFKGVYRLASARDD